ncbi:hypothetical protein JTE90_016293 [Oedothorax gibbosus]|uniref:Uncharacterized protein n=1 Tax=Oedothorax gibbosus TaxID=931172 RepID=A0AAV6U4W0_9ARAC|nr:hypothetical protein JTE90_016293 [Oedothorax gibbosus]
MGARNFFSFLVSITLIYGVSETVPFVRDVFATCATFAATVWMAEWLMQSVRKHLFHGIVSPDGKAVFITGCDSGFGHALAKRMDSKGYRVFAGCLNVKAEGATNLKQTCSAKMCVLPLDVTCDQSVLAAKDSVEKNLGKDVLWCVVNNAGVVQSGELDWTTTEEILRVHQVNTFGAVRVAKAFLALLKKSRGRLVNNASACGRFICPGFVGYCMSKSATIAFSEGLRVEMMKWGVKVISIEPFFYKTPLTQPKAADELIEKTWQKSDALTRETYGVGYLENFKENSRQLLSRASLNVHEVIDCFVDAIVSRDPLSAYFPAYLPDKIGIKVLQLMPKVLLEWYLGLQLERGQKPLRLGNI